MTLDLRVVSRSGRELATLQLPESATVKDLKQAFYTKCQLTSSRAHGVQHCTPVTPSFARR